MKLRRHTYQVMVGNVSVGGDAPVVVQSMTNTDTANSEATAKQIIELANAGSEIVRITVNNEDAARQVPAIKEILYKENCDVPIVGDFHYNGHRLLSDFPECAQMLDKYRINPGNVGFGQKRDSQFEVMIEKAIEYNKPVRIGVNWGSLDQDLAAQMMDKNAQSSNPEPSEKILRDAIVVSALESAKKAEEIGLARDKILISCKVSEVQDLIKVYRDLADKCSYPLHLGLTEAGMGDKGIVASTAALSILLQEGVGDTIRVSLTPEPGAPRAREVTICQEILQSLGVRSFSPSVTACPGCGRTTSTYFQTLAMDIQCFLKQRMPIWGVQYSGVEEMKVAVMGCIVNGPGESKHADIGISLPGTGEDPVAPVFIDGKKAMTLRGEKISEEFQHIVEDYVASHYIKNEEVG